MPQVLNLRLQQSALGRLQFQAGTSESFENLPQTTGLSREVWGDLDDVIEVDQQCLPVQSIKDLIHQSLKGGRGGDQPEWQHLPLPQAVRVMNATFSWASGLSNCSASLAY